MKSGDPFKSKEAKSAYFRELANKRKNPYHAFSDVELAKKAGSKGGRISRRNAQDKDRPSRQSVQPLDKES